MVKTCFLRIQYEWTSIDFSRLSHRLGSDFDCNLSFHQHAFEVASLQSQPCFSMSKKSFC